MEIITSGKLFYLKVIVYLVAITNILLLYSERVGAVIILSIWVFTLYDMGNKFVLGGSEGVRVCSDGMLSAGGFSIESFTIFETGDKLPHDADAH